MMPFDDAGIHLLITQQGQDVLQAGFAIQSSNFDPLDPMPFIVFFHLPIGQALGPTPDRMTGPACGAMMGGWIPTAKGVEDGRLIALIGIGKDRRQMPRTETPLRIVHQRPGLLVGPLADD
jgi:hypothetical protein